MFDVDIILKFKLNLLIIYYYELSFEVCGCDIMKFGILKVCWNLEFRILLDIIFKFIFNRSNNSKNK